MPMTTQRPLITFFAYRCTSTLILSCTSTSSATILARLGITIRPHVYTFVTLSSEGLFFLRTKSSTTIGLWQPGQDVD